MVGTSDCAKLLSGLDLPHPGDPICLSHPPAIPRLAEILAATQKLPSTDLDREQIMRLFKVKRRAALLLMKQLEPKMLRGSWRIDRSRLAAWLEEQMHDSDVALHSNRGLAPECFQCLSVI